MTFIGKVNRGRKKAFSNIRLVHLGAGLTDILKDNVVVVAGAALNTTVWTELFASLAATTNYIEIFDSTGETLALAIGAAASEIQQMQITPGGNGPISIRLDGGVRLTIKAVSNIPQVNTETVINFYD
jgi:hypothetical protein